MNEPDFVLCGPAILVGDELRPAAVHVREGRIVSVTSPLDVPRRARIVQADRIVLPGLVDAHVHVNEPGRTEWEGYSRATAAALSGGVTTLVDMPLNGIPPLLDEAALRMRLDAIARSARCDVALWAGLVSADAAALPALARAGVAGVKVFLCPSGVQEFASVGEAQLDMAMPMLRDLRLPLLAHAEDPARLEIAAAALSPAADPRAYPTWLAMRPVEAEVAAIDLLVRLCRRHRTAVHVVHVSSREGCERIAAAKAEGLPVTAETCPHYLAFVADQVPDGGTVFKCAPPIRGGGDREALRRSLREGVLDLVASDHSPCPAELKLLDAGDFRRAWGGIAGLEALLPAAWDSLRDTKEEDAVGIARLGRLLAGAPARLAGLLGRKGRISPGYDADFAFVNVDPHEGWPIELHHRSRPSPWNGRRAFARVEETWLRGRLVYSREAGFVDPPSGEFVPARRGAARPLGN